jgi:hypothetical protein
MATNGRTAIFFHAMLNTGIGDDNTAEAILNC